MPHPHNTAVESDPAGCQRIGLLGGTFDPVHFGHLRAAQEIQRAFSLTRVEFLPAGTPPHKTARTTTAVSHRLAMLRLALEGNPGFFISDAEAARQGLSFLVDTLRDYRRRLAPGTCLFFIMGMDSFREISTWHHYPQLFSLCHFVVLSRPGYPRPTLAEAVGLEVAACFQACGDAPASWEHNSGHRLHFHEGLHLDISSSQVRDCVQQGRDASHLVPRAVLAYLLKKELYSH